MITYKNNKKWKTLHVSLELHRMEGMETKVMSALTANITKYQLKSWEKFDIVDIKIVSTSHSDDNTVTLELMVIVAANIEPLTVEEGQWFVHYKNAKRYKVVSDCKLQVDDIWVEAVAYKNEEGDLFARPLDEFSIKFERCS